MSTLRSALLFLLSLCCDPVTAAGPLRVAAFKVDVTPPLGTPLCDALCPPASEIVDPLSARGIILAADDQPIVLCAVDWVGIGNGGYDAWRSAIAKAAGTDPSRVAVHCLHQHDAPGCDFEAEELLAQQGLSGACFHVAFAHQAIDRVATAVREARDRLQLVTHVGVGVGRVEGVASNRRVMGPDGKVKFVRYSSCKDEKIRAEPEGVIDPDCRLISFWDGDRPIASVTYYTTHPQSYYGAGGVSADFVGMARSLREKALPDAMHVHFNGASGNVTAGKYNDGSREMRPVLAERLAAGMQKAWENTKKFPIAATDIGWRTVAVALPPRDTLDEGQLKTVLTDSKAVVRDRVRAARDLAWLRRCRAGHKIELSCLKLGPAYVVHMPGELFVEYQLAAEKLKPDAVVCMAAYGDYGPGYIGTSIAYGQGGYETSRVSRVAPEVEAVLLGGLAELLK
ncbi:MAG: hypothetical protein B7Z73_11750 [Planctomycetia bacterium 21-64-5]|nr:MAG: hypothetical protein B7Z73_11750 [Planctomycetia bacterium 21-64-5]HQU42942.1 hypothetical protein [Pirellulales bacterium]